MLRKVVTVLFVSIFSGCMNVVPALKPNNEVGESNAEHHYLPEILPKLIKELSLEDAEMVLGKPNRIVGSGLTIYIYTLDNEEELLVGFSNQIIYAFIEDENGIETEIQLKEK